MLTHEQRLAYIWYKHRQRARYGAEWDESKHPRAADGRFGSGGGGGKKTATAAGEDDQFGDAPNVSAAVLKKHDDHLDSLSPETEEEWDEFFAAVQEHPHYKEVKSRLDTLL